MNISRRRVAEMLRKEFRQMFRDPRMKAVVFVSPIVQLLLFGYAVNTDVKHITTFIVDHDRTALSIELANVLHASDYFDIVQYSDQPSDLESALDHGQAVVGLHIPPGFTRDFEAGTINPIQLFIDGTNSNTGTVAQSYALETIQAFLIARAPTDFDGGIELRVRAWFNPELASRVYNVPGVIGLLLLLMCMLLTALAVVREREVGTLDQLLVTPLRPVELMLGKTIPVAIIGMIDLALITTVAILWFDVPFRGSPFVLITATFVFILAGLSLGLLISTTAKTQQEAFMTMFLFLLPAIILSGFLYPIESMPTVFQWLTMLNPVRHFLEIVRAVFLKGTGYEVLWPQLLVLTLMAATGLSAATVRFRAMHTA